MTKTVNINKKEYEVYADIADATEYFSAVYNSDWENINEAVKYHLIKGNNPLKCIIKGIFPWLYALYLKIIHIK